MSPQFDVRWLSLSVEGNDGLDEAIAAEKRPVETVSDNGRFEALLDSHLRWAATSRNTSSAAASQVLMEVPGDTVRSSRIAQEVSDQLARISQVGVAA